MSNENVDQNAGEKSRNFDESKGLRKTANVFPRTKQQIQNASENPANWMNQTAEQKKRN